MDGRSLDLTLAMQITILSWVYHSESSCLALSVGPEMLFDSGLPITLTRSAIFFSSEMMYDA